MLVAETVMQAIKEDATIAQEIKEYLQWVFSKRPSEIFFTAVSRELGRIPF